MDQEERGEDRALTRFQDDVRKLREELGWLLDPTLGTAVVGSGALAEACDRAGNPGPAPKDLDLTWSLDVEAGRKLLEEHDVFAPTTEGSTARGTLALKWSGGRIEITSYRGSTEGTLDERLIADLAARDMTIGALAWRLHDDAILDPFGGLHDWQKKLIRAVGDPRERIVEHPARWLRYFAKAHVLGFEIEHEIRKLSPDPQLLGQIPREAIAADFRLVLVDCPSPGRFLLELHESGLLEPLAPSLALQFDGRPAGPQRHHPEVGQGLHLILALEWAQQNSGHLSTDDRAAVMVAVLCHDLGKGLTPDDELPAHHRHEQTGLEPITRLFESLPGLADSKTRRLAAHVCELHLRAHQFRALRPGTLAGLYDRYFRQKDYPVELFALAVGADSGGRLGMEHEGLIAAERVRGDLKWLRARCATVDAAAIRAAFPDNERFASALHEARARTLRGPGPES